MRRLLAIAIPGLIACLIPGPARAGNTEHPRTPVLWPDAPCIQTVERSVAPEFEFAYTIPMEDTTLSFDEFEDSRTHQFIGFCRQWPAGRPPPRYISVYDLERAIMAGFEEVVSLDDPEATLETSEVWSGCWTRVTADDERRPITWASADQPVIWDTAALAAGTWLIAGYTWEPPYNLWSRAPWVVRVLDEDPPGVPVEAAASLADTADTLYFDEILALELCVDAEPGSTVAFEWSPAPSVDEALVWSPWDSVELGDGGLLVLDRTFAPPEPSWGQSIVMRATIEQPEGPGYAAHGLGSLTVFKPKDEDGDEGEGEGEGDGDGDGDEAVGDDESSSDDGVDPGLSDPDGCSCSTNPRRGNFPVGLGLALLVLAVRPHSRGTPRYR